MGNSAAKEGDAAAEREPSYFEQANAGYDQLVNLIIRPPRAQYETEHLGPPTFEYGGQHFWREDLELLNERGQRVACSHWQLLERPAEPRPCIVYLHGNASARLEAVPNIALALSIGASLLGIDCAGSGHSDGEFVSLGFFERDDLRSAVAYLRESGRVSSVAFWGHSMGAVAALMHANRDPSVAGMVLDSPFCDLVQLAEELVQKTRDQGVTVPGFAVSVALHFVRSSVQKRAGFDIHAIKPIAHAPESFVPAMFVVGTDDDFVPPHHAKALHAAYAGDANMVEVSGDHNTPRPRFLYDSAAIFLAQVLQCDPAWRLEGADCYNNGRPPWATSAFGGFGGPRHLQQHAAYDDGFPDFDDDGFDVGDVDYDDAPPARRPPAPLPRLQRGAPSAAGPEAMGMTAARQADLTDSLAGMFGGRAAGSGAAATAAAAPPPPPPPPLAAPPPPPCEWQCARCTLINAAGTADCLVCGAPPPPPPPPSAGVC